MQKRLEIIYDVDPSQGGPTEAIRQQASRYEAEGVVGHVVSMDPSDAPWLEGFPLKVFALGSPMAARKPDRWPWGRYGYDPRLLVWLRAHVHEYDIVVVHGLWNYAAMAARRALVGSKTPYVVFTHGMLDPWFKKKAPLKAALKQIWWLFNEGPLLRHARFVMFTSEDERRLARGAFFPYRVRERTVAYGVADPGGDIEAQTAAFRAAAPKLTRPYLLYLSRIHPKKGCDLLIDAFATVYGPRDDLDLVVAGPGNPLEIQALQRRAATRGVARRVHWTGMLRGEAKWGAFRNAEAFVLPSHQENFGIVVAEALACARPVLITNKINIWREIAEAQAGFVDDDTLAGVERLVRRLTTLSGAQKAEIGARARACFLHSFEIGGAARDMSAACRDAIGAG